MWTIEGVNYYYSPYWIGALVGYGTLLCTLFAKSSVVPKQIASYPRALVVWILQGTFLLAFAVTVGDAIAEHDDPSYHVDGGEVFKVRGAVWGYFLFAYLTFLFISRIYFCGASVIYEFLWACNEGMLIAAFGMVTNRPILIAMAVAAVAMDQFCWWIDLILYIITRKHIIGVMKFLSNPQTKTIQIITTFHHLWFIPLCIYTLAGKFPPHSFAFSCFFTSLLTFCSAFTIPKSVLIPLQPHIKEEERCERTKVFLVNGKKYEDYYLNINSGYEFWPDIPIPFLHSFNDKPFYLYFPFLAITGNLGLNSFPAWIFFSVGEWLAKHRMLG